jgi:methionyl aminopeptidase
LITIKFPEHIEFLKKAGEINAKTLSLLPSFIVPGITTKSIDLKAEEIIRDLGGIPASKNYIHGTLPPYPGSICININEEAVHNYGSDRVVKEGDVVKLDLVVDFQGWKTDSAVTILVPPVKSEVHSFVETCYLSMWQGIKQAREGNKINDIGKAIEEFVKPHGFGISKQFIGHGIGRSIHEDPQVPSFYSREKDQLICSGMVIAVEPILFTTLDSDCIIEGWNTRSKTGCLVSHFEHSLLITPDGKPPKILTLRKEESNLL